MTIDTIYQPETFAVDPGLQYIFEFEHVGDTAVLVYEVAANGDKFQVTQGADYNLVLNTQQAPIYQGGTINFLRPHGANIVQVEVARATPQTQLVNYAPYTPFPAETHEFALDKLTMLIQEGYSNVGLIGGGGGGPGDGDCSQYVPLAGTDPNINPITGDLHFKDPLAQGVYTLNHGLSFQGDGQLMLLQTSDPKSEIWLQTQSDAGNSNIFQFGRDGSLNLPQEAANQVVNLKVSQILGVDNTLEIKGFDGNGVQQTSALNYHTAPGVVIAFQEDGEVVAGKQTDGTSGAFVCTTKQYVDDLLGPGAGESNTSSNQGAGVGLALPKNAADLPFRTMQSPSGNILIAVDGVDDNLVNFDLGSSLTIDDLTVNNEITAGRIKNLYAGPFEADDVVAYGEAIVTWAPLSRQIIAGDGLQGGGDLTADRTLSILLAPSSGLLLSGAGLGVDPFSYVGTTGDQSISGVKTFDTLPETLVNPTNNNQLTRKNYVDSVYTAGSGILKTGTSFSVDPFVVLGTTGDQSVDGIKTFTTLPQTALTPTLANQFANKAYVDSVAGGGFTGGDGIDITGTTISVDLDVGNGLIFNGGLLAADPFVVVNISGTQTISGQKTFNTLPLLTVDANTSNGILRRGYADGRYARTSSSETISGLWRYSNDPEIINSQSAGDPDDQIMRKDYIDLGDALSDQRLKENIREINTQWCMAMLQGQDPTAEFDWKKDSVGEGKHAIGWIAQTLQSMAPDAIRECGPEYIGVDLKAITAILWKQNRELLRRVEALGG